MNQIRTMQDLQDVLLEQWSKEELAEQHEAFSQLSPWLNSQGVSLHHQIIDEIKNRGGLNNT
ncbi:hypothetical protein [Paenibacillus turpanensis]|uniref:hypothetical protein n=1 Tax=Paenibacillus turpanensis TaxID=2689078 RepID=UPI00140D80F8|nr:hypothetical protein [Paenibacillus turpanensis]